jgi:hypothetical protein
MDYTKNKWSRTWVVMGPDSYGKDNARTVSDLDQREYDIIRIRQ